MNLVTPHTPSERLEDPLHLLDNIAFQPVKKLAVDIPVNDIGKS
jgi:hypothetical protein